MRKAQGLPLNVIIIAIIALAVLIVLLVIFTGRTGKFAKASGSCVTKGGECAGDFECDERFPNWVSTPIVTEDCEHCCIKLYEKG